MSFSFFLSSYFHLFSFSLSVSEVTMIDVTYKVKIKKSIFPSLCSSLPRCQCCRLVNVVGSGELGNANVADW
jgi:hypothetical protein